MTRDTVPRFAPTRAEHEDSEPKREPMSDGERVVFLVALLLSAAASVALLAAVLS